MNASTSTSVKSYDLIEQLGESAFGAVYRAHQLKVGREVAVKEILSQYANQTVKLAGIQPSGKVRINLSEETPGEGC